jgi:hypothetical protein
MKKLNLKNLVKTFLSDHKFRYNTINNADSQFSRQSSKKKVSTFDLHRAFGIEDENQRNQEELRSDDESLETIAQRMAK